MDADELVGRSDLLALLSRTVSSGGGPGDALLLFGERGIGTTSCLLVVETLARAAGHLVLGTAGNEAEIHLPFAGLQRLLHPLLDSIHALPDVQRRGLLTALGLHDGPGGDLFVVSVATLSLLREASERRPVVVTVDDLHWLDVETRHVLAFVMRRLEQHPVLVVATSSSVEGLPDFRDLFAEEGLTRLDDPAARRLLQGRAPDLDAAQREWVVRQAAGNPLALVELAKACVQTDGSWTDPISPVVLPPVLERAFAGRLHDLSSTGRDVVLIAAMSSDESLPEILAATALLSESDVTTAVLEAPKALGLLRFDELHVHFAHPLVRIAIAQTESVSRRQAAHGALGAVITVNSYRRAWHRALGTAEHDDAIAAELEAAAGLERTRHGDAGSVITALERAAQLSRDPAERGRRLVLAAGHAARLGQSEVVVRLLGAAAGGELSDLDRVRAELLGDDFEGVVIGDSNKVLHLCSTARRAAASGATDLALELAYAAARRRWAAPVDARARFQVIALAKALTGNSGDARAVALLALADPVGHGRQVLSMLAGLDLETAIDGDSLSTYAVAARAVGDHIRASRLLERAEVELRADGLLGPLARNLCLTADLHLELGAWDRAAAALAELETLSTAIVSTSHRAAVLSTRAKLSALRRETATGLDLVAETEQSPGARSGSAHLARAQIVRGIAYLSSGRQLDAFLALRRVFEPGDPCHHVREQLEAVGYLAEAAFRSGRQAQAHPVVERMQLIADQSGSPMLAMQLSYARAVLASDDAAEALFLSCLASDAAGVPWLRARLQLAHGQWLRRQQFVRQSRAPLQASLSTFERLGAVSWAEDALSEVKAAGVAGDDEPAGTAASVLSAQELRIALLAARGLSNREIGQQLYISPRTVGSHLYRIFPKLGISTRGQIASRLSDRFSNCHQA
jgi:DNA-binding CsgD family transcriptional regulator